MRQNKSEGICWEQPYYLKESRSQLIPCYLLIFLSWSWFLRGEGGWVSGLLFQDPTPLTLQGHVMSTVKITLCTQTPKVWLLSPFVNPPLSFQILTNCSTTVTQPAAIQDLPRERSRTNEATRSFSISSSWQLGNPPRVHLQSPKHWHVSSTSNAKIENSYLSFCFQ